MENHEDRSRLIHETLDTMIRTARLHHHAVDTATEGGGIHRGQRRLLMHLCREGDTASQRRLSDALEVTPACVARMLKGLTEEGYVTRTGDSSDQRRNRVAVTRKGLDIVEDTRRTFEELDSKCFSGFSAEDIALLNALLRRLHANLKGLPENSEL